MEVKTDKLQDILDQIKNGKITPQDAAGMLQNTSDPIPSDEEIIANGKELEDSIKPIPSILNDDDLNDLLCSYSGEELANRMFWLILNRQGYLNKIIDLPDFTSNRLFDSFLVKKGLETELNSAKEMVSDNFDLDGIGIKFSGANRKVRKFNIGPFGFEIHVLTNKGIPIFFHVAPPKLDLKSILNKISERLKPSLGKCSQSTIDENAMFQSLQDLLDKDNENKNLNNIDDIVDEVFCEPNIPINPETGEPLFTEDDLKNFIESICEPEPETPDAPVVPEVDIEDTSKCINQALSKAKGIFKDIRSNNELKSRNEKAEKELEELLYHYRIIQNFYNSLYSVYNQKIKEKKKVIDKIKIALLINSKSSDFLKSIKDFSVRFDGSSFSLTGPTGISFSLSYPIGLGKKIEYETVKSDSTSELLSDTYQTVDITKIQLGMEFSENGILGSGSTLFLKSYKNFITIKDQNPKTKSDFFSFVSEVQNTNKEKNVILKKIEEDHGFLYSNLLESSASPWLFFNAGERGDNDARKTEDLKPSNTDKDGNPNKEFSSFWGDYKTAWNKKYTEKQKDIDTKIEEIKKIGDSFIDSLADYYIVFGSGLGDTTKGLKEISDGIDQRVTQIKDLLMSVGETIQKLEKENSGDVLAARASEIKCGPDNPGVKVQCPSDCCGSVGSLLDGGRGPCANHGSVDCPTFYTKCYWKEFSKKANNVGLLPMLSGIPPIENPALFLPNLGMKYWPVGYLPPSFIPLPPPLLNPLDGLPFIRIPMPMVWTKVDPIVIPLPIGLMVIFIPFIGGFMPSPLVFFHDFLTGTSIFLLGMRGFRFVPRKSDPIIPDPLENYKKFLSSGIPNYLFPFGTIGGGDVDSPARLLQEVLSNVEKQLTNVQKNVDFSKIQKVQDDIAKKKKDLETEALELKRNRAIGGSEAYNEKKKQLDSISKSFDQEKINAIKSTLKDHLKNSIDLPDVVFPKDSKNLLVEIPSPIKAIQDINIKKKLGTIPEVPVINLHSRILSKIDNVKIPEDPKFSDKNKKLSSDSKIVASFDNKLSDISKNEKDFAKMNGLVSKTVGDYLNSKDSPLSSKSLLSFKPNINPIPKLGGDSIAATSTLKDIPNPVVDSLKSHLTKSISLNTKDISNLIKNTSIGENKILRQKDLKLIVKNAMNKSLSSFPVDLKKFSIPNPASAAGIAKDLKSFTSSLEIPAFPPKKSGNPGMPLGIGGIPQIPIPGKVISNFLVDGMGTVIDKVDVNSILPGGLDSFQDLSADDIKSMSKNIATNFTKNAKIPAIQNIPKIPLTARPQDFTEMTMSFMPVHPFSDIAFTLLWTKYKMVPKIPIPSSIVKPIQEIQNSLIYNIPWPVAAMMGRNVLNIINPLYNRDDIPRWDRMSLKNPFFVVFLDEFLRSAADISGGFKFFAGAGKLFYPLPDLEINLGFGTKIKIN
jgi:hypothetical protein